VLLLIINLIGLGLGPTLTGWVSDMYRSSLVGGGVDVSVATAQGLRYALCTVVLVNVWSAFHYLIAARTLREDLVVAREGGAALAGV